MVDKCFSASQANTANGYFQDLQYLWPRLYLLYLYAPPILFLSLKMFSYRRQSHRVKVIQKISIKTNCLLSFC